jgi:hypothetical protein
VRHWEVVDPGLYLGEAGQLAAQGLGPDDVRLGDEQRVHGQGPGGSRHGGRQTHEVNTELTSVGGTHTIRAMVLFWMDRKGKAQQSERADGTSASMSVWSGSHRNNWEYPAAI